MTQEEKEILWKDLCARLPYGVKCACSNNFNGEFNIISPLSTSHIDMIIEETHPVKPYLRPMSSMTEIEAEEYNDLVNALSDYDCVSEQSVNKISDWLNAHYFDCRGLIPMGIALEAPEGMYKTE